VLAVIKHGATDTALVEVAISLIGLISFQDECASHLGLCLGCDGTCHLSFHTSSIKILSQYHSPHDFDSLLSLNQL
jgi:hypothetical protein